MANKFLARYKDDEEKDYAPRQRGLGRRVFEGISKKAKKFKVGAYVQPPFGYPPKGWTEPEDSDLNPDFLEDWREMKARRARDLERGRPPTYEDAEESMRETKKKRK